MPLFTNTNPQSTFVRDTAAKITNIMSCDSNSKMSIYNVPRSPESKAQIETVVANNLGALCNQISPTMDREKLLDQLQRSIIQAGAKSPSGTFAVMQDVFNRFIARLPNLGSPSAGQGGAFGLRTFSPGPDITVPVMPVGAAEDSAVMATRPRAPTRAA